MKSSYFDFASKLGKSVDHVRWVSLHLAHNIHLDSYTAVRHSILIPWVQPNLWSTQHANIDELGISLQNSCPAPASRFNTRHIGQFEPPYYRTRSELLLGMQMKTWLICGSSQRRLPVVFVKWTLGIVYLFDLFTIASLILINILRPFSFVMLIYNWLVIDNFLSAMHVTSCRVEYHITWHHFMYPWVLFTCHVTACHMVNNVCLSDQTAAPSIVEEKQFRTWLTELRCVLIISRDDCALVLDSGIEYFILCLFSL